LHDLLSSAAETIDGGVRLTVLREWGRRGSPGTVRLDSYQRRDEAEIAKQRTIKRRLQHGYTRFTLLD
jgi:predicted DNA-binding WGR domain protein